MNWKISTRANGFTYQNGENPELMHIIESGFKGTYIVTFSDAFHTTLGKCEVLTTEEIKAKYSIDIPTHPSWDSLIANWSNIMTECSKYQFRKTDRYGEYCMWFSSAVSSNNVHLANEAVERMKEFLHNFKK